ncbi:MAG: 4Fe-4S dicluster domain-containing protein, partial [Desulfurococcaceae archaeon]
IKKISYELEPFKEYNRFWARTSHFSSPVGNARKCHFCIHRVEAGKLPKCVDSCLGRATYFGDLNDPQSLISKINASALVAFKYKEELGTKPIVTYVVSSNRALARYLAKI